MRPTDVAATILASLIMFLWNLAVTALAWFLFTKGQVYLAFAVIAVMTRHFHEPLRKQGFWSKG